MVWKTYPLAEAAPSGDALGESVAMGGLDMAAPVMWEKWFRTTVVLGQISLRKKL
jgi:hypothetical protein